MTNPTKATEDEAIPIPPIRIPRKRSSYEPYDMSNAKPFDIDYGFTYEGCISELQRLDHPPETHEYIHRICSQRLETQQLLKELREPDPTPKEDVIIDPYKYNYNYNEVVIPPSPEPDSQHDDRVKEAEGFVSLFDDPYNTYGDFGEFLSEEG
jgi:hypothetical protein